jgi:hypothetical protein
MTGKESPCVAVTGAGRRRALIQVAQERHREALAGLAALVRRITTEVPSNWQEAEEAITARQRHKDVLEGTAVPC